MAAPRPPSGQLLREPGAIYLEDFAKHPVKIGVVADAPIFFQPDKVRSLGVLRAGQSVELQAVSDTLYRVRGQAQQGQVAGWVDPGDWTSGVLSALLSAPAAYRSSPTTDPTSRTSPSSSCCATSAGRSPGSRTSR